MRTRSVALVSLSVLPHDRLALAPATAATPPTLATLANPPTEFGSDYDAPVAVPHTQHCEVQIVCNRFRNFDPYESTHAPVADRYGDPPAEHQAW